MNKSVTKVLGVCCVGRHVNGRDYVLLKFVRDLWSGAHVGIGPIVNLTNDEWEKKGFSLVVRSMKVKPIADARTLPKDVTLKELLKIKRKHTLVRIYYQKKAGLELEIIPLHSGHGWRFDIFTEEVRTVALPVKNKQFLKILSDAFEDAS